MLRLLFSLAFLFAPLHAAELSGSWSGTLSAQGRARPFAFEFRQSTSSISGAFGTRSDFLWPIESVSLSGSTLRFDMKAPMGGPGATFEGTISDGAISGRLTSESPALTGTLDLKRTGPPSRLPASFAKAEPADDLAALSDEFERPASLENWKNLSDAERLPYRIDKIDIGKTSPGQLVILPRSGAWWAGYHGVYLFKEVKGDFVVTTRLKVTGKTGGEPASIWTISGLLLRAPGDLNLAPDQREENWIYLMTGRGPAAGRVVDAKSTLAGDNAWDITPAQPGWYELRLARLGPLFAAMCRAGEGEWTVRKLIFRPDLPETLQAGINVTSDFALSASMPAAKYNASLFPERSSADSLTAFDYVRFSRVSASPALRAKLAGADVLGISGADLLALLK